ncbi:MAG: response regulator, partial [Chloroflexi bacterium]|nr:response regulator [Chloroflexota bacterium]
MAKILIVEDRPTDRELLVTLLRQHTLFQASDGLEALRLARAEKPDLIIADVLLPRMDGYELVRQIRRDPEISRTPVIYYTASFDEKECLDLARDLGVVRVLVKPTPPEILLFTVGQVLADKGTREILSVPAHYELKYQRIIQNKLFTNVMERDRAVESLRRSEEGFRLLAENATDIVFRYRVRPSPSWEYVNRAVNHILGYAPADFYADNRLHLKVVHPDSRQELINLLSDSECSERTAEIRWVHNAGEKVWTEIRSHCVCDSGGVIEVIEGIARDITERKRLDELKEDFISLVSHELRTPLTVIMGGLHLLQKQYDRLSRNEADSLIQDSMVEAESMADMVENLLELSRARANRLTLTYQPLSLPDLAQEVAEKIRNKYPVHRVMLEIPRDLPRIEADETRMRHVLHNLLDNSCKYSAEGSEVKVRVRHDTGSVVVSVIDHGIGIAVDDQGRIFEGFQRLDTNKEKYVQGTGIGLVVCKRLLEAHQGEIWIQSEFGKGSTFSFRIPLKHGDAGGGGGRPAP